MRQVVAGPNYPMKPPEVRFVTKIALPQYVDAKGMVTSQLPAIARWKPSMGIADVLCSLREAMAGTSRIPQPPPDATF